MSPRHIQGTYKGMLAIGDPHLEARVPGFRRDDYPSVILEKLRWTLNYAHAEHLLPMILGDLFHLPRNNPNWLLVSVMQLFDREVIGIYGNHDVHENTLTKDDSIRVISEAGRLTLLDEECTCEATIGGRRVIIGGTPWGKRLPLEYVDDACDAAGADKPLVIWLCHHDMIVPGYEDQGRIRVREIPGIDLMVNGHIHRCLGEVEKGGTRWITPGNISRRARSDATRHHKPAVLRIDVDSAKWDCSYVPVPHQPFDDVFHEAIEEREAAAEGSAFVAGLAELQARRTQTGEGLALFIEKNLDQFEADVADEIRNLVNEVMHNE